MGIRGKLHGLIRSYLTNRFQSVKIGDCLSTVLAVLSGVPQGSILGPLLFLVFINDLVDNVLDNNVFLFADDGKILSVGESNSLQRSSLQTELSILGDWATENGMVFSDEKCSQICFRGI